MNRWSTDLTNQLLKIDTNTIHLALDSEIHPTIRSRLTDSWRDAQILMDGKRASRRFVYGSFRKKAMLPSDNSLSMIKVPSAMMLSLAIASMISPAEAQAVTCTSSSPQCCWVVRIWQLMGKTTSVSSTSSTACCSMSKVTCNGSKVTVINWAGYGLRNSIPSDIGKLVNLTYL